MRIALTFNEKRSPDESEAEFDTADTIGAIARTLASAGHVVTPLEVSRPVDRVISDLARLHPELVFNVAEGRTGRFREAFYPALFEQLGLAYTGSGASALALCMDKALAKRVVAAARVPTPYAQLVRRQGELRPAALPVIVKPNYEGSSKGITQASVVTEQGELARVVEGCLARYPDGALVEQFIEGADVAVGWVDGLGVLPPIGYRYAPTGPHAIYDLELKQGPPERIDVVVPAPLDALTTQRLLALARRAFDALGVAGYGRADFRVTPEGSVYFLEMNPLPTLDPRERDLYAAAAAIGESPVTLLSAIVGAALRGRPADRTNDAHDRAVVVEHVDGIAGAVDRLYVAGERRANR